jgi:hypothetical protein
LPRRPVKRNEIDATERNDIEADFRIMARRDGAGIRLITRNGNDFTSRFPVIVAAVTALERLVLVTTRRFQPPWSVDELSSSWLKKLDAVEGNQLFRACKETPAALVEF